MHDILWYRTFFCYCIVESVLCRLYKKRQSVFTTRTSQFMVHFKNEKVFGANLKITIVLPILSRRQIIIIIIIIITTKATINPSDFRNQNIRFPTNHCARRYSGVLCNTNTIIFHNITQSPSDNIRLCRRNCIFRRKRQLYRVLSVQRTSFAGNTPTEGLGRLFIILSFDW